MSFFVADEGNSPDSRCEGVEILHVDAANEAVWLCIPVAFVKQSSKEVVHLYNDNPPSGRRSARICPVEPQWVFGRLAVVRPKSQALAVHFPEAAVAARVAGAGQVPSEHETLLEVMQAYEELSDLSVLRELARAASIPPGPFSARTLEEWLAVCPVRARAADGPDLGGATLPHAGRGEAAEWSIVAEEVVTVLKGGAAEGEVLLVHGSGISESVTSAVQAELGGRDLAVRRVSESPVKAVYSERLRAALAKAERALYLAQEREVAMKGWLGFARVVAEDQSCLLVVGRLKSEEGAMKVVLSEQTP